MWVCFRQVAESSFGQSGFLPELPSSLNCGKRKISVSPWLPCLTCFIAGSSLQQDSAAVWFKECACIAWSELLQHPRAEDFSNQQ